MTLEYLLAVLIVVLVPGTGMIYTVSIGLMHKRSSMIYAALGCTLAITPHLFASIFGLATLLNSSVVLFNGLKLLGILYLLYMVYNLYMDKGILEIKQDEIAVDNFTIVKNGFLMNVLNPKLSVFFLAFIPQFVLKSSSEPVIDMAILGAVFMFFTLVAFVIYGLFAHLFQQRIIHSPRIFRNVQKIFAAIFGFLAYKLANI